MSVEDMRHTFEGTGKGGFIKHLNQAGEAVEQLMDDTDISGIMEKMAEDTGLDNVFGWFSGHNDSDSGNKDTSRDKSVFRDSASDVTTATGVTAAAFTGLPAWVTNNAFLMSQINGLREAVYKTLDINNIVSKSKASKVEKFDTENLKLNYESLKAEADKFSTNNKEVRELVYEYITSSPSSSALYGPAAGYATSSWDNNITATNNTDDLLMAMALETLNAQESAINTDNDLSNGFKQL